ncbi:MAG: hypothetical protein J0L53_00170 [Spirochaetes bacterium]|nr:hypothetical protein [Spirochaetota bacterium]
MKSVRKSPLSRISFIAVPLLLFASCNLLRSSGKASFVAADKPGMGRLKVTGPSGWQCIEFEKAPIGPDSSQLQIAGKGRGECPLFGSYNFDSTSYPTQGETKDIPADKPTLVYKNEAGNFEIYVLLTKDKEAFSKIGK